MGRASAKITLDNPRLQSIQPIEVQAPADTAAGYLCLPGNVAHQLQLEATSQKEVTTADGNQRSCPYVGPVHVQYADRECYVGAVVLGDEVLLGAIPMEDMDLVVIPKERRVAFNQRHPRFAATEIEPQQGLLS